jgi:hypothetical protein
MNNWDQISDDSRVWVYGAKRALAPFEVSAILRRLADFCDEWSAHGTKLDCGFTVLYNQLIILAVDEKSAAASGCSIDTSVQIFREIDKQYDLDLFNRLRSYQLISEGLRGISADEIKTEVEKNTITSDTKFIDVMVASKKDIAHSLTKPMRETWLSKYL